MAKKASGAAKVSAPTKEPPKRQKWQGRCRACGGIVIVTSTVNKEGLLVFKAPEVHDNCGRRLFYDIEGPAGDKGEKPA